MNWSELLKAEIESHYRVTDSLMAMTEDASLGWKPATGANWMTTGQLLEHLSTCCGPVFRGFVTGDWGMPAGVDPGQMKPEEMLPPAESLSAVKSVAAAREALAADKRMALGILAGVKEEDLAARPTPAPWDPTAMPLGRRLLQMVIHLFQHKGQLYYYLKLQGKPVNTGHLWGG